MAAVSSAVTLSSTPIDRPFAVLPLSLKAPRMVVLGGESTKPPSGASGEKPGGRPMRRE